MGDCRGSGSNFRHVLLTNSVLWLLRHCGSFVLSHLARRERIRVSSASCVQGHMHLHLLRSNGAFPITFLVCFNPQRVSNNHLVL